MLIEIRNKIMHYKWYGKLSKRALRFVTQKTATRGYLSRGPEPYDTATVATARWAVDTTHAMFNELTRLLDREAAAKRPGQWFWDGARFPRAQWVQAARQR